MRYFSEKFQNKYFVQLTGQGSKDYAKYNKLKRPTHEIQAF